MEATSFIERKAREYFERNRKERFGPTKDLSICRDEVIEDYKDENIKEFASSYNARHLLMLDNSYTVTWADGTVDKSRICYKCRNVSCSFPIHTDKYRTLYGDEHDNG